MLLFILAFHSFIPHALAGTILNLELFAFKSVLQITLIFINQHPIVILLNSRPNDRNISQHCWAQDTAWHVGYCWLKFENGQHPTGHNRIGQTRAASSRILRPAMLPYRIALKCLNYIIRLGLNSAHLSR